MCVDIFNCSGYREGRRGTHLFVLALEFLMQLQDL